MSPMTPPMKNSTAIAITVLFAVVAFAILIALPEKKAPMKRHNKQQGSSLSHREKPSLKNHVSNATRSLFSHPIRRINGQSLSKK